MINLEDKGIELLGAYEYFLYNFSLTVDDEGLEIIHKVIQELYQEHDKQNKNFKFYRIKHKPTGLFFVPSRSVKSQLGDSRRNVKSNLSKKGKIYHHKPQLTLAIGSHIPIFGKYLTESNNTFRTKESDWEIVGYE